MVILRGLLLSALFALLATSVSARPDCNGLIDRTAADRLVCDDIVVLARPDPKDPFRFAVSETLRGDPALLAGLPGIPFIVDRATRRRLQTDPAKAVLMTFGPEVPAGPQNNLGDGWHRVMLMTADRRDLIERLLADSQFWRWNDGDDAGRFDFFAMLLTKDDIGLQNIAFAEVARASYARIRTLADALPPDDLWLRLMTIENLRYAPLSILLLSVSTDPVVRDEVAGFVERNIRSDGPLLYAWALAGIEVTGPPAIDGIGRRLAAASLSQNARRDLVLALSVAGTARPEMRQPILPLLRQEALSGDANLDLVARTFLTWSERSLDRHFREKLTDPDIDFETRYLLGLALAGSSGQLGPADITK